MDDKVVYNWSYDDGPRVKQPAPLCKEYVEKQGNLIEEALKGTFDVITHGCNCYCAMAHGIAVPMRDVFGADKFKLEGPSYKGDFNKLGNISYEPRVICPSENRVLPDLKAELQFKKEGNKIIYVVNSYTQYGPGVPGIYGIPLDYDALRLCMRKLNREFKGLHIGMPKIGCGLAKGDWSIASRIIKEELIDCKVTVMVL